MSPPRLCPDGGACHHECATNCCFRVATCEPLSASGWTDWPQTIRRLYGNLYDETDLRPLLHRFVDHEDGPCSFDHHGICQEHPGAHEEGDCAVAAARKALGL